MHRFGHRFSHRFSHRFGLYRYFFGLLQLLLFGGISSTGFAIDNFTDSPIVAAIKAGDINAAKKLLPNPSQANARNPKGKPLLLLAAELGSLDMFELLLASGANPDIPDSSGAYVLHHLVQEKTSSWLEVLAQFDPNWQVVDQLGRTALMLAAIKGDKAAVLTLLQHGATTSFRDLTGRSAADYAEIYQQQEILEIIRALDF